MISESEVRARIADLTEEEDAITPLDILVDPTRYHELSTRIDELERVLDVDAWES